MSQHGGDIPLSFEEPAVCGQLLESLNEQRPSSIPVGWRVDIPGEPETWTSHQA